MRLTRQQLDQFDRDGYLFFPGRFRAGETRVLTEAVPELYARHEAYNVREKGSDAVRTSSRSTARWPSKATSGSGTRTTAPGSTTT